MINRRTLSIGLAVAGGFAASPLFALETKPFSRVAFEAAKAGGKPILVEVMAPWCPTCKAQRPILSELKAQPKFKDLVVFEIDFDSQKDALHMLNVRMQSTLITFKGGKETGRSTGDTNRGSIEALLGKAI